MSSSLLFFRQTWLSSLIQLGFRDPSFFLTGVLCRASLSSSPSKSIPIKSSPLPDGIQVC